MVAVVRALWRRGSGAVRAVVERSVLSEWTQVDAAAVGVEEATALCALAVALIAEGRAEAVDAADGMDGATEAFPFAKAAAEAALSLVFCPALDSRPRGIVVRRLLPAVLPFSAASLLRRLSAVWSAALAPYTVPPAFLPSTASPCPPLLFFPRPPPLSEMAVVHPQVADLFLVCCLLWAPLMAAFTPSELEAFDAVVLSMTLVGLSSDRPSAASQSLHLLRLRAKLPAAPSTAAFPASDSPSLPALSASTASAMYCPLSVDGSAEWEEWLGVMDALQSQQQHLVLSVLPRLYRLTLPCAFVLLAVERALTGSVRLPCALSILRELDRLTPSLLTEGPTTSFARLIPALLTGPLLAFTNTTHGEVPSERAEEGEGAAQQGRPSQRWGGSAVSHALRTAFCDFIDRLPPTARAAFLRRYLSAVDGLVTSHLSLRLHLAVLASVRPQAVFGDASYAHLLRLLSSRLLISSAQLKPQLQSSFLGLVSRLTHFRTAVQEGADERSGDVSLSLSTFAELLSSLPPDALHSSSHAHCQLMEALQEPQALLWLTGAGAALDDWLRGRTSTGGDEGGGGGGGCGGRAERLPSRVLPLRSAAPTAVCASVRLRLVLRSPLLSPERPLQPQPPAEAGEDSRGGDLGSSARPLPTPLPPPLRPPSLSPPPWPLSSQRPLLAAGNTPSAVLCPPSPCGGAAVLRSFHAGARTGGRSERLRLSDRLSSPPLRPLRRLPRSPSRSLLSAAAVRGGDRTAPPFLCPRRASNGYRPSDPPRSPRCCADRLAHEQWKGAMGGRSCSPGRRASAERPPRPANGVQAAVESEECVTPACGCRCSACRLADPLHSVPSVLRCCVSSVSGSAFCSAVERMEAVRFTLLRHLLPHPSSLSPSPSRLFSFCLEALDSATDYLPLVFDCARLLLPSVLPPASEEGEASEVEASLAGLLSRGWTAFSQAASSERLSVAFLALMLHPALFTRPSLHSTPSSPYRLLYSRLLSFASLHIRFAFHLAVFSSFAWESRPSIGLHYADASVALLCFHQPSDGRQEAESVVHLLSAYEVAHMTHSFPHSSVVATPPLSDAEKRLLQHSKVGRGEALVRLVALLHVERLLGRAAGDGEVQRLLAAVLDAALSLPALQSGPEMREGSGSFLRRLFTLQTLAVLSRALPLMTESGRMESLRRRVLELCWLSFERGLNAVTRHLLEVLLCSVCLSFPSVVEAELLPSFALHSSRPTVLASLVVVAGYAALDCLDPVVQPHIVRLVLPVLLPLLSSNFGHTRLVAQSAHSSRNTAASLPAALPPLLPHSLFSFSPLCCALSGTCMWSCLSSLCRTPLLPPRPLLCMLCTSR